MNEKGRQTKLLAAIAVLAMVVCVFAAVMPSDVSAVPGEVQKDGSVTVQTENDINDVLTGIGTANEYQNVNTIVLTQDVTLTATLSISKTVTIDLNGFKIVDSSEARPDGTEGRYSTITVTSDGNLTIIDSSEDKTGIVDNVSHGMAALYNNGIVILNGGNFTRSLENGNSATESGGNSYYNIVNHGTMTINNGVKITQDGHYSSMIENGWYSGNDNSTGAESVMTINGGTFSGGLNTVKNDDYGKLTINGGTFENISQAAVLNWNVTTISGGSFTSGYSTVLNGYADDEMDQGKLTINGGTFTPGDDHAAIETMHSGNISFGTVDVNNGTFNGDVFRITNSTDKDYVNNGASGTVSIGDDTVAFDRVKTTEGLTFSNGTIFGNISNTSNPNTITVSGDITIDGLTMVAQALTVSANAASTVTIADLIVPADKILTVGTNVTAIIPDGSEFIGDITNNSVLRILGAVAGNVNAGTSAITTLGTNGSISGTSPEVVVSDSAYNDDNTGLQGQLNFNLELSTSEYLSDNFVIAEGYTLTIHNGGSLSLNGHKLTVNGTLVIENGGSITGIGDDEIVLAAGGAINNSGVIGMGSTAVTVTAYQNGGNSGDTAGSVSLQNVTGISFNLIRTVDSTSNPAVYKYQLAFSGNAIRNGAGPDYAITVDGAIINGDLTIGNSVKFIAQSSTTVNGAIVTINGIIGGQLDLKTGSTVILNGQTYNGVVISAITGEYQSSTPAALEALGSTTVTVNNVRGITVEVTSVSYMKDKTSMTEQKMLISGNAASATDIETDGEPKISYSIVVANKANASINGAGIYVEGELYIPAESNNTVTLSSDTMVTVSGQISSTDDIISKIPGTCITGTAYKIGTTDAVYYITGFDQAYGQLANAENHMITVYGKLTLSGAYTVAQGQTIELSSTAAVIIDDNGSVTVENGGIVNGAVNIEKVTGVLTVIYGGSCTAPDKYAVKTTNDNGDVTYSGLAYAMGIANEGETVNLVQTTTVNGSLTIPAGVTLDVNQGAKLTVTRNLTVNGTLLNHGTVDVQRNVAVAGKIDNTEMTGFTPASDTAGDYSITVSGTGSIVFATVPAWTNYNGAYYTSGTETIFTTLSNAADSVAKEGIVPEITVIGTYSENATVNANGIITIASGATVSVTEIVLNDCQIDIVGTFTGSVTGQSGEEGSTVASTVQLSKASGITVSNYDQANSANVTVWYTMVTTYDDENEATEAITDFGSATESMTVSAGVVTIGEMTIQAGANNGPSVTVATGAELVIPADVTVISNGMTAAGTVTVEGTLTATSNTVVSGTMDIELEGEVKVTAMTVTGTVNVASQEDQTPGTLTVNGILTVGDKPTTLGAAGAIVGKVTFGTNVEGSPVYVKAYAGADMSAAVFAENEGVSTEYYINDVLYMTVYAKDTNGPAINDVGSNAFEVYDLPGYVTADIVYKDADGKEVSGNIGSIEAVYATVDPANAPGVISVGNGLTMYIDNLTINNFEKSVNGYKYALSVGTHTVSIVANSGYNADAATITFNGQTVANGGTIEITADMIQSGFTLSANGAVAESPSITIEGGSTGGDSGMGLTDYLLIILVILIVIMAIMVAFRLMRS